MGVALFLTGALAAFVAYGPEMAPAGKFTAEQMNAWYFFWTKLAIGSLFGIVFTLVYHYLPLSRPGGMLKGLLFGLVLWFLISLWNLSHPLVYGPFDARNQIFWLVYTLGGFLGYGLAVGFIHSKSVSRAS